MSGATVIVWSLWLPDNMEVRIMVVDRLFFYGYGLRHHSGGWTVEEADTAKEAIQRAVDATGYCETFSDGTLGTSPRHLYFSELPELPVDKSPATVAERLYKATYSQGSELTS